MLHFLQPAATLLIGLAFSAYGLIQSLLHRPPTTAFAAAVQALPEAIAVALFILGVVAIVVGAALARLWRPRHPSPHPRDQPCLRPPESSPGLPDAKSNRPRRRAVGRAGGVSLT